MIREVGSGKPFATISAAIADLEAAVGSTPFTETQTIRVYNGSYTETPMSQNVLKPTATYRLVIEAAAGNSPILDGQNITTYGFYFYETDYLTIKGFEIKNFASAFSTYIYNCDYVIFENLIVHDCASGYGIYFIYASKYGIIKNNVVYNCYAPLSLGENCEAFNNNIYNSNNGIGCRNNDIVHNNIVHDITFGIVVNVAANCKIYNNKVYNVNYGVSSYGYGGADNAEIHDNELYNGTVALILVGGNNMKIYNNYVYDNPYYIGIDITGNNNLIYNNLIKNIGYVSLSISNGSGNRTYNNTIYGAGWLVSMTSLTGANYLTNNILFEAGGGGCIFTVPADVGYIKSDRNCLYKTAGYIAYIWNTIPCATLAIWQANSGQDLTSISADPLFVNAGGVLATDYKLQNASPCIAAGVDLSAYFTYDFLNYTRHFWEYGAYYWLAIPVITNQFLSNYAPTQEKMLTAEMDITGRPAEQVVIINDHAFALTLVSGIHYRAIIWAYQIGLCTGQTAKFIAINDVGGSDEFAPSTITVSANGNYDIALIETAIVNLLTLYCPGLKTILNYEPKLIPELPALTLWYDGFDQTQTEAVSYTVNHKWLMRLYVRLLDAKTAQDDVKALSKSILSAFKSDLNLSNTVLKETIPSGIVSAVLDQNNTVLIVEFNLTTMTEED